MHNKNLYLSLGVLLCLFICFSCNTNKKQVCQDFYINELNDTIAKKIDWNIIVTKYEYTSEDRNLLNKMLEQMGVSDYSVMFYTQDIYDYLCEISKMEFEKYPDVFKSNYDFWNVYEHYLLNFCYCAYDTHGLKRKDYHFVKEEDKRLFYIDGIRVRDCKKTTIGYYLYNNADRYVFWTDKELNEEQIKHVLNTNKPVFMTQEVEFVLLDDKGKPKNKYISVLCYPNGNGYSFTFYYYNNHEYKYSFDPNNIKSRDVYIGMSIEECTRILGINHRVVFKRDGSTILKYSNNQSLRFENGILVNIMGFDENVED